jgi:hypothetical protein
MSILDTIAITPWARTLWQGFVVDGLAAAGAGLIILLADGDLTSPLFWSAAGLMVAKSLLTSLASYMTRLKPVLPEEPNV